MTEPSNAVLSEQVSSLRKDFYEFKKHTDKKISEVDKRVTSTKELADEVSFTMLYMKESIDKMDNMMSKFIGVVGEQNTKIDDFVNSDKRMSDKRQFLVSVLQVGSGILIAVISIWATGKL